MLSDSQLTRVRWLHAASRGKAPTSHMAGTVSLHRRLKELERQREREALQRQVQNPQGIPNAARSCNDFWAPLVSGGGEPWYQRKTREDAADREESCIFQPGGELADGPAASSE